MADTSEVYVTISSEALIKGFLSVLNRENLINNKTYTEALNKLKKGDVNKNVD